MLWRAMQAKMVRKTAEKTPKMKECPKCYRRRSVEKYFGFRTQHGLDGRPQRSMVQSYCVDCRKEASAGSKLHTN